MVQQCSDGSPCFLVSSLRMTYSVLSRRSTALRGGYPQPRMAGVPVCLWIKHQGMPFHSSGAACHGNESTSDFLFTFCFFSGWVSEGAICPAVSDAILFGVCLFVVLRHFATKHPNCFTKIGCFLVDMQFSDY